MSFMTKIDVGMLSFKVKVKFWYQVKIIVTRKAPGCEILKALSLLITKLCMAIYIYIVTFFQKLYIKFEGKNVTRKNMVPRERSFLPRSRSQCQNYDTIVQGHKFHYSMRALSHLVRKLWPRSLRSNFKVKGK